MDAETKVVIERIDAKIRTLKQLRETLVQEFGDVPTTSTDHKRGPKRKTNTRKDQVVAYFKAHGRLTAAELQQATKIPRGSIGWILGDKELFSSDENGKWGLKEDTENA